MTKGKLYFAKRHDNVDKFIDTLRYVRPTFFFAIPRVYEKIEEKIIKLIMESTYLKKRLGNNIQL